jgi:endo-1,4-beta-xylanase
MRSIRRRTLLATPAALAVAAADAPPQPALNARARRKGLFFGSAISSDTLTGDPAATAKVNAECGIVVSENAFKWAETQPAENRYDFTGADALMSFADRNRLRVRGHVLVWHESNPDWLEKTLTPANAEMLLTDHIRTVAGRYKGRLAHWDVVNEAVNPDDKKPLNLRDTLWLRALGARYLDIAFHTAASADPTALRVLNDYGTDYTIPWQDRKRGALLDLLADLLHRGVPVQAVGLQAHLDAGEVALDQKILARFVSNIASLGLKVIVTELDVRDQRLPADIPSRDNAVASHARAWLDAVLPNPNVLGVLTWGISDRRSWLNDTFPRPDKLPQRPLPLDTDLNRKKLWTAIAAAIDAAPVRKA